MKLVKYLAKLDYLTQKMLDSRTIAEQLEIRECVSRLRNKFHSRQQPRRGTRKQR